MPFASSSFPGSAGAELSASDASWSKQSGFTATAGVGGDGNWLISTSNTTYAIYQHSGSPASADYDVSADITAIGGSLAWEVGVCARMQAAASTFYMLWHHRSSNQWRLSKCVAGAFTTLGSAYSQTLTTGVAYRALLRVVGSSISGYVDGALVIGPVTDTAIATAGKAGVLSFNSRETGVADRAKLDNFSADDAAGGGSTTPLNTLTPRQFAAFNSAAFRSI